MSSESTRILLDGTGASWKSIDLVKVNASATVVAHFDTPKVYSAEFAQDGDTVLLASREAASVGAWSIADKSPSSSQFTLRGDSAGQDEP